MQYAFLKVKSCYLLLRFLEKYYEIQLKKFLRRSSCNKMGAIDKSIFYCYFLFFCIESVTGGMFLPHGDGYGDNKSLDGDDRSVQIDIDDGILIGKNIYSKFYVSLYYDISFLTGLTYLNSSNFLVTLKSGRAKIFYKKMLLKILKNSLLCQSSFLNKDPGIRPVILL